MRILGIGDLHGEFERALEVCRSIRPDYVLCCGDWGDPEQVAASDLERFTSVAGVVTTFGNHDPLPLLRTVRNADGSPILLEQAEVRELSGLRVAAIGGIWAKHPRRDYHVTDAEVIGAATTIAQTGPVEILLTHGCPVGLADTTPSGTHGGQRCFLRAFQIVSPRIHLCGHLHVAQEKVLKDGRAVFNVGAAPTGSFVRIDYEPASRRLVGRLGTADNPADLRE
jgi:Icc-related predicted phosphoesterase